MDLLNAAGVVPYENRAVALTSGTTGWATGGNPGAGIAPTDDDPGHYNSMMEEAKNLIEGGGLTMSAEDNTQWLQAVRALVAKPHAPPLFVKSAQGLYPGASYSSGISLSFTPPVAGYVLAIAYLNLSAEASLNAPMSASLLVTGGTANNDQCRLSQTHFTIQPVAAGAAITAEYDVSVGTTDPVVTITYGLSVFFVPYP